MLAVEWAGLAQAGAAVQHTLRVRQLRPVVLVFPEEPFQAAFGYQPRNNLKPTRLLGLAARFLLPSELLSDVFRLRIR